AGARRRPPRCLPPSPPKPGRCSTAPIGPSGAAAPAPASRRAGPAPPAGTNIVVAAPALAAALAPKRNGRSLRASCQTGIAVSASSVPVYVASGAPATDETTSDAHLSGRSLPASSSTAAVFDAPPENRR